MANTYPLMHTILVVDDIEINRGLVETVFENIYNVVTAENGADGMKILQEREIDLVLVDVNMPVMDGFEMLKAMKENKRLATIPVIVITGETVDSEKKAFDLGADDFIEQPYDSYIMRKRVENLLERYELRRVRDALNEQKRYRSLFEIMEIAYWEWTRAGGIYRSAKYFEYAVSELDEKDIWDLEKPYDYIYPDDVPLMKKFMTKYPEDEVKKSAVVRCLMKDGSYRWTQMFSIAEMTMDNKLVRLVTIMIDVNKEWSAALSVDQKNKELERIIDSISGGIATYRMTNVFEMIYMSDSLAKRLDYEAEAVSKIQNVDATIFVHPADRELLTKKARAVVETGKPQTLAYRIVKKDKSYKWFRATFYPAGESQGYPMLYEVLTDIAEVNADYVEALNQTNEMVVIADWESRDILYLNQAAANKSGKTISDLFGKKCSQIAHHCDDKCPYCFKDELTYDELSIRPIAVGKKYYLTKGKRILWNGREAFVEYVSDNTAEHNMTEKAVFERNLLTAATKALYPMCIISNLTQNTYNIIEYDDFNTKKAATEGCFDELIEVGASTIPEDGREDFVNAFSRKKLMEAYSKGVKLVPLTHKQIGDDGLVHWNHTTVVFADQLFNDDLYSITFTYNVDDQKSNEARLQQALDEAKHANMAKTAFLSRVSHDMRTPLNGILGLTSIMKESIEDEKINHDLSELELSGKYLLNLINDTLDVSRIENGKLELKPTVCEGKDMFDNALHLIKTNANAKNIHLNISAENIPFTMLYVDSGRIQQVVMNVVGNAIKFSPENGIIDITMKNISVENGIITDVIQVRDYGVGMSQEFIPHIFEAFSQEDNTRTNSNQGTGLGMAITKQIVQLMGGDIAVESEIGKGSCFTITFKLQIATEEQIELWKQSKIEVNDCADLKGKRILLCEDHPLNTKIATKLLEIKEVIVEHAENGKLGVEMFSNSLINYYDAILMDIRMPIMDGIDASKAIRALNRSDAKTVPIIAMTANAFAEDMEQTREAGMNAHLSKPIKTEILYNTLSQLIKAGSSVCKPKVLIVDDMEINRVAIAEAIEQDYEPIMAESGDEALNLLKKHSDIVAVITDIMMPEMNGQELIRKIREKNEYDNIAILANTQFSEMDNKEEILKAGADDFIYKPNTPAIVMTRLTNVLRHRDYLSNSK